jgi:hypothetical protein
MSLGIHSEVDEQRSGGIFSSSGNLQVPSWMGFISQLAENPGFPRLAANEIERHRTGISDSID